MGAVLVGGRGCGSATAPDGARQEGAVLLTTQAGSPVLAGEPGEGPTTRGPAGSPVTSRERRLAVCELHRLPAEVRVVVGRVRAGTSAGAPFDNALRLLPAREAGYYRRYDVPTLGGTEPSTRALVTGGGTEQAPQEWFYTWDANDSFCRIDGA